MTTTCPKCDIHTICPEHRAERDATNQTGTTLGSSATGTSHGTPNSESSAPLSFSRAQTWKKGREDEGTKLPKGSRKKAKKVDQCDHHAGKVRCHQAKGHLGLHRATAELSDGWTHQWTWDSRGRIVKDKWREERLFEV